jgi:hypothetical protein
MLVLTVAHVAEILIDNITNKQIQGHIACRDSDNLEHEIIVSNAQKIFIHPNYKNNKVYIYDAAIIRVQWENWMNDIEGVELANGISGNYVIGYGFPMSLDDEKNNGNVGLMAGEKLFKGTINIEDNKSSRTAVGYTPDSVEGTLNKTSMMEGFSGTGLFSTQDDRIVLNGVISGERGEEVAGTQLWATSANVFLDLFKKCGVDLDCPKSFEKYKDIVVQEFDDTIRHNQKMRFKNLAEELIDDYKIVPSMFGKETEIDLKCEGNRKICYCFWKEKLKELVVLKSVQNITEIEELKKPLVKMPNGYSEDKPSIEFICTEEAPESILGVLIEKNSFSEQGNLDDGMIMLISNKSDNTSILYTRYECRKIMTNITKGMTKRDQCKLSKFDIVNGTVNECNIAAVGTGRLMQILNKRTDDKMKEEMDKMLIELWEEE